MMRPMSDVDWSALDVALLETLVAVAEVGTVTGAAVRLGVTQSAVSHQLEKLRAIVRDPLFVRSGRGVVATDRAVLLADRARELLVELEQFTRLETFDPAQWQTTFTVAANDLQRDLLLPRLVARLRSHAPGVSLRVIPSDVPAPAMLRNDQAQLVISPRPPEGSDILVQRLFEVGFRVFYDPAVRSAPADLEEYLDAEHVTVVYEPRRQLAFDEELERRGIRRRLRVTVPGFAGVASFVRGSDLLVTAPGPLRDDLLRGLADAPVPVRAPALPMFLAWHERHRADPAHRWVRDQVLAVVAERTTRPATAQAVVAAGPRASSSRSRTADGLL
jgi:DNA-binding transcriptional LysR family regulator